MRTQGGGGSKIGQILRTSFMDGPFDMFHYIAELAILNLLYPTYDEDTALFEKKPLGCSAPLQSYEMFHHLRTNTCAFTYLH